jgi:hypothetical protein
VTATLHPTSAAALLCKAEAYEQAAVVLRQRNPTASQARAAVARGLRTLLERTSVTPRRELATPTRALPSRHLQAGR